MLIPHADDDDAAAVAGRVVTRIGALGCTAASVGLATWRPDANIDGWLRRADEAMYRAKRRGGNRYRLSYGHPTPPRAASADVAAI